MNKCVRCCVGSLTIHPLLYFVLFFYILSIKHTSSFILLFPCFLKKTNTHTHISVLDTGGLILMQYFTHRYSAIVKQVFWGSNQIKCHTQHSLLFYFVSFRNYCENNTCYSNKWWELDFNINFITKHKFYFLKKVP